jgi:hypothetical protein
LEPILTTGSVPLHQLGELEELSCCIETLEDEITVLKAKIALLKFDVFRSTRSTVQLLLSIIGVENQTRNHNSAIAHVKETLGRLYPYGPSIQGYSMWSNGTYGPSDSVYCGTNGRNYNSSDTWAAVDSNSLQAVPWLYYECQPPTEVSAGDIYVGIVQPNGSTQPAAYVGQPQEDGSVTWAPIDSRHPP